MGMYIKMISDADNILVFKFSVFWDFSYETLYMKYVLRFYKI